MSAGAIYLEQISAMSDALAKFVEDLSDEQLATRPGPYLNPPGFIYFHLLRVWDLDLNVIINGRPIEQDAWHRGSYSDDLGYSPDGKGGGGLGLGFGFTDHDVNEVPYRMEPLRRYHQQLMDETRALLDGASDQDIEREVRFRDNMVTVGARLQHTVAHCWNHTGELRMTKSMLGFHDPTTPPREPAS